MNNKFFSLPKKLCLKIKKRHFIKDFKYFHISSGFEKNCKIIGKKNIYIGENNWFGENCELIAYDDYYGDKLSSQLIIQNNVRVQIRSRITCANKIIIEDDVLIAPDVFITDHNHGLNPTLKGGYSPQPLLLGEVKISKGCWLGHRVIVLPNVTIGEHSIIGAGSVVTKDIPPYSIAVGSPARVIKQWDFENNKWLNID